MGKFAFIGWDWKGSMDPRQLTVINAAIGEATVVQEITDHSRDGSDAVVRTPDLTLAKDDWNALRYAVMDGEEMLFVYELEDADEVFEMSQAEARVLVKMLTERPEPEPVAEQGVPCTVEASCPCGWRPGEDDCPMCARTEHEKQTGHITSVRIVEHHARKKS